MIRKDTTFKWNSDPENLFEDKRKNKLRHSFPNTNYHISFPSTKRLLIIRNSLNTITRTLRRETYYIIHFKSILSKGADIVKTDGDFFANLKK